MTEDYSYFKDLSPRQQLNDLMHKYAQMGSGHYGASWGELDKRWASLYGDKLSWKRWRYNQDHGTGLTIPGYLDAVGMLEGAISIGHGMTGNIMAANKKAR